MLTTAYLSQEGFEELRRGHYVSREINTTIKATINGSLWDVEYNNFTYRDIAGDDLEKVIEAIHDKEGTTVVVILYNLQLAVKAKKLLPIKEAV